MDDGTGGVAGRLCRGTRKDPADCEILLGSEALPHGTSSIHKKKAGA